MHYVTNLDPESIKRYSRQIILGQIGIKGQKKLEKSKILIIGLGGLGSPVLTYLLSAGIGMIGIVDYDIVEKHNLQRQTIHKEKYIGRLKTESALNFAQELNSTVKVIQYQFSASTSNLDIIEGYDLVLDCSDNINVRYIISDMCKFYEKPMILASVLRFEGQIFCLPSQGPCYRCLFPEMKENLQNCDTAGVMGPVCGIIGSMQATEAIKCLLGNLKPCLHIFDAWKFEAMTFDLSFKAKKNCNSCKKKVIEVPVLARSYQNLFKSMDKERALNWDHVLNGNEKYKLVDLRPEIFYNMSHVKNSVNVPADILLKNSKHDLKTTDKIAFICKRGITAKKITDLLLKENPKVYFIKGGLERFCDEIDPSFPLP